MVICIEGGWESVSTILSSAGYVKAVIYWYYFVFECFFDYSLRLRPFGSIVSSRCIQDSSNLNLVFLSSSCPTIFIV